MSTPDPITIVDAVADDLRQHLDVTDDAIDWRHASPDGLTAENAPWLAVWIPTTSYELLGTETGGVVYEDRDTVTIEWAEAIDDVESLTQGEDRSNVARMRRARAIVDRLRTYASAIPGLTQTVEGTLVSTAYDTREGGVWTARTTLALGAWPG